MEKNNGQHNTGKPFTSSEMVNYKSGYVYSYEPKEATWTFGGSSDPKAQVCAKIFLGCVPMIFSALSYLYWRCHEKGGWRGSSLKGAGPLKDFMVGMGFKSSELYGSKQGSQIFTSTQSHFADLKEANKKSYSHFVTELHTKGQRKLSESSNRNKNSLSVLHYIVSLYFNGRQRQKTKEAKASPTTIREMLYFFAALPYSPVYGELETQITSLVGVNGSLDVADSGLSTANNKLSADQIQEYLTASCFLSSGVLGIIQEPAPPQNSDDPFLHDLFCNSMGFAYPSGASLLYIISNYTYALQFQLHFLYQQCSNTYTVGCGWRDCRYGYDINTNSNTTVPFHICEGFKCNGQSGCSHGDNSRNGGASIGSCTHNKKGEGCGQTSNSPLQAFLTDKLKGFSRGHPSDSSSHLSICSGYMCHVPMGFNPNDLRAAPGGNTQGENICLTLRPFCGGFNTPLRQLSEKLGCLTKRTPRTLGDLFGFVWNLNGQLFKNERPTLEGLIGKFGAAFNLNNLSSDFSKNQYSALTTLWSKMAPSPTGSPTATVLSLSLESMAPAIPFLYQLFMAKDEDSLPLVLFDLYQQCHKVEAKGEGKVSVTHNGNSSSHHNHKCSTSPADLYSLQTSQCSGTDCGPYLYPLTHSDGATYAPRHASTYLSWVLYLSDDLQSWFQEMLNEFQNIDCNKSGCKYSCNHSAGKHGVSTNCSCPSVVQCGGTLPLLYRHGFRYFNPLLLMGGGNNQDSKRKCSAFAQQLQFVISGDPLSNMLTSIDDFLFLFRYYFLSNLSGFWTIYVCIILYTLFYLLDTLHLRSHLKLTSSQAVPPLALLTSGKPLLIAKLTYITQ
ncbi:variant erythrocyte surface antigen-1 family protein [Babesia caballi]|uniref:Variant erythrocyte surface antigen-1 family protein n=1 Tax=Babesia caballi TaxID=5871 RepID=A0AAV4LWK2_BABCB|nr:variant erythrocyte surface antigen-1 family protein [Babesia caballi]